MQVSRRAGTALVAVASFLALSGGCALMPKEEPIPEELAVFFTASTGGEFEPCG